MAEVQEPVVTTGGVRVLPGHDVESCLLLDLLAVPGGW
jgi:hypothetical protein